MYTENNKKLAEAELGPIPIDDKSPWPYTDTTVEFKLLQTDAEINREPLLSANASPLEVQQRPAYADHPVDYFVPDFGMAHEMIYTENNIKLQENACQSPRKCERDPLPKDDHPVDYKV